jgi:hypothetical protein
MSFAPLFMSKLTAKLKNLITVNSCQQKLLVMVQCNLRRYVQFVSLVGVHWSRFFDGAKGISTAARAPMAKCLVFPCRKK